MPGCAFYGCANNSKKTRKGDRTIRYFSFPKDKTLRQRWIHSCKREDSLNVERSYVCSDHFKESDIEIPLRNRLLNYHPRNLRILKADAVPVNTLGEKRSTSDKKRVHRASKGQCPERVEVVMLCHDISDPGMSGTSKNVAESHMAVEVRDGSGNQEDLIMDGYTKEEDPLGFR